MSEQAIIDHELIDALRKLSGQLFLDPTSVAAMRFTAWKRAARLVGYEYYTASESVDRPLSLDAVKSYQEMQLDLSTVKRNIHSMDLNRAFFLASLVSLNDPREGSILIWLIYSHHGLAANEDLDAHLTAEQLQLLHTLRFTSDTCA